MNPLILLGAALFLVAGGTLTFGAVYPWAFTPLAIGAALLGGVGIVTGRKGRPPVAWLTGGLALIAVAMTLQLVPMRASLLARLSPGTDQFLRQQDLSYLTAVTPDPRGDVPATEPSRPISIAPANTMVGIGLFAALAIFLVGSTRIISRTSARPLADSLLWLGVALAVLGIVQDLTIGREKDMLVYGFWRPLQGGSPFGPFINRNHFGGWMLMVLPIALARTVDRLLQAGDRMGRSVHDLLSLTRGEEGGAIVMSAASAVVMGLSLVLTRSRSAVGALAIGAVAFGVVLARQDTGRRRRVLMTLALAAILGLVLTGAGVNTAFGRFGAVDTSSTAVTSVNTLAGRAGIWRDTLSMAGHSPLTGLGLNSYGTATIVYQSGVRTLHWAEAHNDYLQLAAEGGLLVGLPSLLALGLIVWQVRERFREAPRRGTTYWTRVGAVVGLISIGAQAVFEFSLQMPANALLFALLLATALHRSPNVRTS